MDGIKETVSSRHNKIDMCMNSQRLGQHVQHMHTIKPDKNPRTEKGKHTQSPTPNQYIIDKFKINESEIIHSLEYDF